MEDLLDRLDRLGRAGLTAAAHRRETGGPQLFRKFQKNTAIAQQVEQHTLSA